MKKPKIETPDGNVESTEVAGGALVAQPDTNAADAKPEATGPSSDGESEKYRDRKLTAAEKAAAQLDKAGYAVSKCEAAVEQAKGNLKAAVGDFDAAVAKLRKVLAGNFQPSLPGLEDSAEPVGTADNWPISELGTKQLAKLLGDEIMEASKNRDEPLGMTGPQLEKFESADIHTIADLETRMKDKPHDWWEFLAKKADATIVNRVLNSWREFRMKNPIPERPKTILEKMAEDGPSLPQEASGTIADLHPAGASA